MIKSSCHCGAIKLEIDGELPENLTSCNCSICRKSASLMGYYHPKNVKRIANIQSINRYIWGDKCLAFISCTHCGCFIHWESINPNFTERMGVNVRLFENVDISKIPIRRFDGANTWKFLD